MPKSKNPKSEYDYYPGYEDPSPGGRRAIDAFNNHMSKAWKAGTKRGTPPYEKVYTEAVAAAGKARDAKPGAKKKAR